MLVLSRKKDERIIIDARGLLDGQIVITVVEIRGDKVRLGIEAPEDMPVHREEVYRKIQSGLPKLADLRGSAPGCTGRLSSVEFVRQLRDGAAIS